MLVTNDRGEVQDAMDDGTGVEELMRLQTKEVLPMLDRLMAAMSRILDVGEEVEVLGTALEKGLLDLALDNYIPDSKHSGEVIENPRNLKVIKQFVGSIKATDRAKATYKQNIMEGQGIDEL
jgi:hypothetical protein